MLPYFRLRLSSVVFLFALACLSQISRAAVTLSVKPNSVDLPSVNAGSTSKVSDNSASLTATGTGTASFTATIAYGTPPVAYKGSQNWLTVSPSTGNITAGGAPVTITLTGNPTGLQAGPYTATVTFTAGSSAKLTVTFTLQGVDLTAGLKAPLTSLSAGSKLQAGEIDVTVTTSNGSAASQSIQVTTKTDGGNWLLTSADSPVTIRGPGTITITVDATSLAAGNHTATVTIGCVNGAPCLPQSIQVSVQVTNPKPTLTSITPNTGSAGASVAVTLVGTGLNAATAINAGTGISVNSMNVVSATQITATLVIEANASAGARSVTVTTPGGTTNTVTFTVVAAITLKVDPDTVALDIGIAAPIKQDMSTSLTAKGSGIVTFKISDPTYVKTTTAFPTSPHWLTISTPTNSITAGDPGVPITIQVNSDGLQPGTYSAAVKFTGGGASAPLTVTINIQGTDLGAGLSRPLAALAADTTAQVGTIGVIVKNPDGSDAKQTLKASSQTDGGNWLLTSADSQLEVTGSSSITLTVNASGFTAGSTHNAKVKIECVNGTCLPVSVQISVQVMPPPPTLTSIAPASGAAGSTVAVTLTGTNLTGATAINTGGGIGVNSLDAVSPTKVTANFVLPANATEGSQNVTITTPSGTSGAVYFTITPPPPPTLGSIAPNSGQAGTTVPVNLLGSNLSGATAINAGSAIAVSGLNAVSSTQLTANFAISPTASSGDQAVIVTTPGGLSNSVTFTITQASGPTLTGIVPNSGSPGATVPVTISGANLAGITAINAGTGITVTGVAPVSSTQLAASFAIAANAAAGNRSVTITTPAGTSNPATFTVAGPEPGAITAVLPHIAAGNSFVTEFAVVNSGSSSADFSISFHDDNGNAIPLPVNGFGVVPKLSDTLPPNGVRYYKAGDPSDSNGVSGSGLVNADPSITIQAIFRRLTSNIYYEAAVPSTTGSNEFEIPFDATTFSGNGAQIYTGFAIANVDGANTANVTCTARDSQGNAIPNAVSVPALPPYGHWASASFSQLNAKRGTIDCTSNTKVGPVALRSLGTDAISSLPVTVKSGASTLAATTTVLPHIAAGGSFVTGFYVVNSGATPANFSISFHDDGGKSLSLPFTSLGSLPTLADSIPGNGAKYYEAGTPNDPNGLSGSGLVTADPSITIQAIFRRLTSNVYYEAAVPTTAGSREFEIPFDATTFAGDGTQIYTGFAITNMDGTATANLTCTARDSQGTVIPNGVTVPALAPYGHWASASFPQLQGMRGSIDCSSNTKVGPVALRALGPDAISSLPVIVLR